jgi:hypothetical protein
MTPVIAPHFTCARQIGNNQKGQQGLVSQAVQVALYQDLCNSLLKVVLGFDNQAVEGEGDAFQQ